MKLCSYHKIKDQTEKHSRSDVYSLSSQPKERIERKSTSSEVSAKGISHRDGKCHHLEFGLLYQSWEVKHKIQKEREVDGKKRLASFSSAFPNRMMSSLSFATIASSTNLIWLSNASLRKHRNTF